MGKSLNREGAVAAWDRAAKVDDPDARCAECGGDGGELGLVQYGTGWLPGPGWIPTYEPRCAGCCGGSLLELLRRRSRRHGAAPTPLDS